MKRDNVFLRLTLALLLASVMAVGGCGGGSPSLGGGNGVELLPDGGPLATPQFVLCLDNINTAPTLDECPPTTPVDFCPDGVTLISAGCPGTGGPDFCPDGITLVSAGCPGTGGGGGFSRPILGGTARNPFSFSEAYAAIQQSDEGRFQASVQGFASALMALAAAPLTPLFPGNSAVGGGQFTNPLNNVDVAGGRATKSGGLGTFSWRGDNTYAVFFQDPLATRIFYTADHADGNTGFFGSRTYVSRANGDEEFLSLGFWLQAENLGEAGAAREIGVFAHGNQFDDAPLPAGGEATYSGGAAGLYGTGATAGVFDAAAVFTARFGGGGTTMSGELFNFYFSGLPDNTATGLRVNLQRVTYGDSSGESGFFNGDIQCDGGGCVNSNWNGRFLGAQGFNRIPGLFAGNFDLDLTLDGENRYLLGAFGAGIDGTTPPPIDRQSGVFHQSGGEVVTSGPGLSEVLRAGLSSDNIRDRDALSLDRATAAAVSFGSVTQQSGTGAVAVTVTPGDANSNILWTITGPNQWQFSTDSTGERQSSVTGSDTGRDIFLDFNDNLLPESGNNWLLYGLWIEGRDFENFQTADNDDTLLQGIGVFADGVEFSAALPAEGRATYSGDAYGVYEAEDRGGFSGGLFRAETTFEAFFSGVDTAMSGRVHNFQFGVDDNDERLDYGVFSIVLGTAFGEQSGGRTVFSGAVNSCLPVRPDGPLACSGFSGNWGGQFFGVADTDGVPNLFGGTFGFSGAVLTVTTEGEIRQIGLTALGSFGTTGDGELPTVENIFSVDDSSATNVADVDIRLRLRESLAAAGAGAIFSTVTAADSGDTADTLDYRLASTRETDGFEYPFGQQVQKLEGGSVVWSGNWGYDGNRVQGDRPGVSQVAINHRIRSETTDTNKFFGARGLTDLRGSLDTDEHEVVFGWWLEGEELFSDDDAVVSDIGVFAVGADISGDSGLTDFALPVRGGAAYQGESYGIYRRSDGESGGQFIARVQFEVQFGGERATAAGTMDRFVLDGLDDDFGEPGLNNLALNLGVATYSADGNYDDGSFTGGTVTCGDGGVCRAIGAGDWRAQFFGRPDTPGLAGAASLFGGTFGIDNVDLLLPPEIDGGVAADNGLYSFAGGFGGRPVNLRTRIEERLGSSLFAAVTLSALSDARDVSATRRDAINQRQDVEAEAAAARTAARTTLTDDLAVADADFDRERTAAENNRETVVADATGAFDAATTREVLDARIDASQDVATAAAVRNVKIDNINTVFDRDRNALVRPVEADFAAVAEAADARDNSLRTFVSAQVVSALEAAATALDRAQEDVTSAEADLVTATNDVQARIDEGQSDFVINSFRRILSQRASQVLAAVAARNAAVVVRDAAVADFRAAAVVAAAGPDAAAVMAANNAYTVAVAGQSEAARTARAVLDAALVVAAAIDDPSVRRTAIGDAETAHLAALLAAVDAAVESPLAARDTAISAANSVYTVVVAAVRDAAIAEAQSTLDLVVAAADMSISVVDDSYDETTAKIRATYDVAVSEADLAIANALAAVAKVNSTVSAYTIFQNGYSTSVQRAVDADGAAVISFNLDGQSVGDGNEVDSLFDAPSTVSIDGGEYLTLRDSQFGSDFLAVFSYLADGEDFAAFGFWRNGDQRAVFSDGSPAAALPPGGSARYIGRALGLYSGTVMGDVRSGMFTAAARFDAVFSRAGAHSVSGEIDEFNFYHPAITGAFALTLQSAEISDGGFSGGLADDTLGGWSGRFHGGLSGDDESPNLFGGEFLAASVAIASGDDFDLAGAFAVANQGFIPLDDFTCPNGVVLSFPYVGGCPFAERPQTFGFPTSGSAIYRGSAQMVHMEPVLNLDRDLNPILDSNGHPSYYIEPSNYGGEVRFEARFGKQTSLEGYVSLLQREGADLPIGQQQNQLLQFRRAVYNPLRPDGYGFKGAACSGYLDDCAGSWRGRFARTADELTFPEPTVRSILLDDGSTALVTTRANFSPLGFSGDFSLPGVSFGPRVIDRRVRPPSDINVRELLISLGFDPDIEIGVSHDPRLALGTVLVFQRCAPAASDLPPGQRQVNGVTIPDNKCPRSIFTGTFGGNPPDSPPAQPIAEGDDLVIALPVVFLDGQAIAVGDLQTFTRDDLDNIDSRIIPYITKVRDGEHSDAYDEYRYVLVRDDEDGELNLPPQRDGPADTKIPQSQVDAEYRNTEWAVIGQTAFRFGQPMSFRVTLPETNVVRVDEDGTRTTLAPPSVHVALQVDGNNEQDYVAFGAWQLVDSDGLATASGGTRGTIEFLASRRQSGGFLGGTPYSGELSDSVGPAGSATYTGRALGLMEGFGSTGSVFSGANRWTADVNLNVAFGGDTRMDTFTGGINNFILSVPPLGVDQQALAGQTLGLLRDFGLNFLTVTYSGGRYVGDFACPADSACISLPTPGTDDADRHWEGDFFGAPDVRGNPYLFGGVFNLTNVAIALPSPSEFLDFDRTVSGPTVTVRIFGGFSARNTVAVARVLPPPPAPPIPSLLVTARRPADLSTGAFVAPHAVVQANRLTLITSLRDGSITRLPLAIHAVCKACGTLSPNILLQKQDGVRFHTQNDDPISSSNAIAAAPGKNRRAARSGVREDRASLLYDVLYNLEDGFLVYGAWGDGGEFGDANVEFGGFAVGTSLPHRALTNYRLPVAGSATYTGNAQIRSLSTGALAVQNYAIGDVSFTAEFGREIFVRGDLDLTGAWETNTQTGVLSTFTRGVRIDNWLTFQRTRYVRGGGIVDGGVACGVAAISACGGSWGGRFFGTPDNDEAPRYFGGTFRLTNVAIGGGGDFGATIGGGNVYGGFGAELSGTGSGLAFEILRPLASCTTAACVNSFLPAPLSPTQTRFDYGRVVEVAGLRIPRRFSLADNISVSFTNADAAYATFSFDGEDNDEYLLGGVWLHKSVAGSHGGFALGATFSADLPTDGTAKYFGRGAMVVRDGTLGIEDFYSLNSELDVAFAADGEHTLSGTLTEVDSKFALDLGNSVFADGAFSGGRVTCGTGGQCDDSGVFDNVYNAQFFGVTNTVAAARVGAPTKFGGAFKADNLSVDGLSPTNLAGAFGAELFLPPPPFPTRCQATECIDSFLSTQPTITRPLFTEGALARFDISGVLPGSGATYISGDTPPSGFLTTAANTRIGVYFYNIVEDAEYLLFGAWTNIDEADADNRGGFVAGAEFTADLPNSGSATYQGVGQVVDGASSGYNTNAEFTAVFKGNGVHTLSGTLTEVTATPKFTLEFGEADFLNGEFGGGTVTCGTGGQCDDSGISDNSYNAKLFGTAGAGGNPTKLGGVFKASGLSLDGNAAANVAGAFGGELQ